MFSRNLLKSKATTLTAEQESIFAKIYEYQYEPEFTSEQIMKLGIKREDVRAFRVYAQKREKTGLRIKTAQSHSMLSLYNEVLVQENESPVNELPTPDEFYTKSNFDRLFHNPALKEELEALFERYKEDWDKTLKELYEDPSLARVAKLFDHYATFKEVLESEANSPVTPLTPIDAVNLIKERKRASHSSSVLLNLPKSDSEPSTPSGRRADSRPRFSTNSTLNSTLFTTRSSVLKPVEENEPSSKKSWCCCS